MNMRERASRAADNVCQLLGAAPNEEQGKGIADAIEREIIEAVLEESQRCASVAHECCSPDLDTAHKIRKEIESAQTALVANLSSLR
jgi:hypothetical protein